MKGMIVFIVLLLAAAAMIGCGRTPTGPSSEPPHTQVTFSLFTRNTAGDFIPISSLDDQILWNLWVDTTHYNWVVPDVNGYRITTYSWLKLAVCDTSLSSTLVQPLYIRVGSPTAPLQQLTSRWNDINGNYFVFRVVANNVIENAAPQSANQYWVRFLHAGNVNTVAKGSFTDWKYTVVRWQLSGNSDILFQLMDSLNGQPVIDTALWAYSYTNQTSFLPIDSFCVRTIYVQDSLHYNPSVHLNQNGTFSNGPGSRFDTTRIFPG